MKPRNIFITVTTIIFLVVIFLGFKEIRLAVGYLASGIWYYLLLALLSQIFFFIFQAEIRRSLYRILDIREKFQDMLQMTFSAMFLGTAIPSLHMSALALFMGEAKAKHYSQSKALVASLTFILFDFLGFFCFLILGLVLLFRLGDLNRFQIFGAAFLFAMITGMAWLINFALQKEERIGWFFGKIAKLIPKSKREKWMPQKEIDMIARESIEAKDFYAEKKYKLWQPLLLSLITQSCGALTLTFCFLAYGIPFTITTILIVYAMAMLFQAVAITPYGIGTAEVALTLTLTSLGMPINTALLLMMTFRVFTFWIPMAVGYLSTRRLKFIQ